MKKFWNKLSGHKTQIMAIITLVMGYLLIKGYIDKDLSDLILGICTILLVGTTYHGIKKNGLFKEDK